jgi:hypothetical protein
LPPNAIQLGAFQSLRNQPLSVFYLYCSLLFHFFSF